MYPISGTVHNKTLNKCILSLDTFVQGFIVNCTRDRIHLFKVLLRTVPGIGYICSRFYCELYQRQDTFVQGFIVNCTRDMIPLFKVLLWTVPGIAYISSRFIENCTSLVQFTIKPWTNVSYLWYSSQQNLEQMYPIPGKVHNKT
jgi:hypothetical protein